MPNCIMLVPFVDGYPKYPGVDMGKMFVNPGDGVAIGFPPDKLYPQYIPVWLRTSQAVIDQLSAKPDCLYLVGYNEKREFTADVALTSVTKTSIIDKLKAMGYDKELITVISALVAKAAFGSDVALGMLMNILGMPSFDIEARQFCDGSSIKCS